jgi:hypothetical protein
MHVYFSTNERYYSRLFRLLFREPASHVGVGFSPGADVPLVVDCTQPYGKIYHLHHWKAYYKIIYFMRIDTSPEDELEAYRLVTDNAVLKPYDYDAYVYGFYLGIKWKIFGINPPKTNRFSSPNADLCTEIFNPIKPLLLNYDIDLTNIDLAALTPHMLADELYHQTRFNDKVVWHGFPTKTS